MVKVGKIVTLDQCLIRKQLGRMPAMGQQQLIHIVMTIFGAGDRPDGDACVFSLEGREVSLLEAPVILFASRFSYRAGR